MDGINFSDLGSILNTLKENPQMVQMLMSMLSKNSSPPPPEVQSKPQSSGFDANTLAAFMSMLGKNDSAPPQSTQKNSNQGNPLSVFGSQEEIKNRIALLNAVRPYLSETRKERLEVVIKLLRLAELGSLASLLG